MTNKWGVPLTKTSAHGNSRRSLSAIYPGFRRRPLTWWCQKWPIWKNNGVIFVLVLDMQQTTVLQIQNWTNLVSIQPPELPWRSFAKNPRLCISRVNWTNTVGWVAPRRSAAWRLIWRSVSERSLAMFRAYETFTFILKIQKSTK